jgi:hypothetical protein
MHYFLNPSEKAGSIRRAQKVCDSMHSFSMTVVGAGAAQRKRPCGDSALDGHAIAS